MARPISAADSALAALVPLDVAREVCELVLAHLARFALPLSPAGEIRIPSDAMTLAKGSNLGLTVQALTQYAQRGLTCWDWETDAEANDACVEVLGALYSHAGDPELSGGALDTDDVEPDTAIGLVLVAARARMRVAWGNAASARDLSVLAGLHLRSVQRLCEAGEIRARRVDGDYAVSAREARRWLAARRVAGIAP